jgi:hypothetical protein
VNISINGEEKTFYCGVKIHPVAIGYLEGGGWTSLLPRVSRNAPHVVEESSLKN